MKTRLLLSASFIVLFGSLGIAKADTFDDVASHLAVIEAAAPADELSKTSNTNIKAVNDSVQAVNDAKAKAAAAAADLAKAQAAAGLGSASPDAAYQAQANKVANQLDVIDGLKKMADSGDIKKNLDTAVANQKTAETWNNKAQASLALANKGEAAFNLAVKNKDPAAAGYTDFAKFKSDATTGAANASKVMAQAQYLAGVAADAASAALKDPKSAEAQLRDKIVSATSDYNDLKSGLDKLNNVKNATVALQRANDDVSAKKADATAKAVTALNSVNADMMAAEAAKAEAAKKAAAVAATKPASGATAPSSGGMLGSIGAAVGNTGGSAPLIGNAGGALVGNAGGTIISHDAGTIISHDAGSVVSNDGGSALAKNSAGLISEKGGGLISNQQTGLISNNQNGLISNSTSKIISDNSEGLISNKAGGLISEHGAGLISEHGAGLISNSASAMMHIMSVDTPKPVASSNAFKQDSIITANSNSTYLSPSEQLAANVKNNLNAADQKTLNAMIADVKAGKTLTAAQENQATALLNQAAKGLDPSTLKSLQQSATVNAAVTNAKAAVNEAVVNQAITTAKNDPTVVAAVQNLQAGKPLTSTQRASLNSAISSTVNNLQVPDAQKQALTQTATTQVATVSKAALTPATPPAADLAGMSPAMAQQLVSAGPAVIQGLQAQQAAAMARGDKTTADALGRDVTSLQSEIAAAKKIAAAPPSAAAGTTTVAVAPAGSTTAAVQPATTSTPSTAPTLASAPAKTEEAPARITAEQGKAVQQALRTIPGNLTKAEEKNFSNLSTLVDRAATKGLTPEEAVTLKAGLAALAEKHPKAEKQAGLTTIGSGVALAPKPKVDESNLIREGRAPAGGNPVIGTEPPKTGNTAPTKPSPTVATTTTPAVTTQPKVDPSHVMKDMNPEHQMKERLDQAKANAAKQPTVAVTEPPKTVHTDEVKHTTPAVVSTPKVQPAPAPSAPKPTLASAPAVKPPSAPAAKPQTCTPNMVNGKMQGMTCR